jgi:hypothetical protein
MDLNEVMNALKELGKITREISNPMVALVHPSDIDEVLEMFDGEGIFHERGFFGPGKEKYTIYSQYGISRLVHAYIFLSSSVERGGMVLFETKNGITSLKK